jgi:acetyl esterase
MTVDAAAAELLRLMQALDPRALETVPIAQARALEIRKLVFAGARAPVASVSTAAVAGPGGEVRVRVYDPSGSRELPVAVFLHGGGWTLGGLDECDVQCRALAAAAHAVVVAVDYRLAPEHRYPAALEDAYAAVVAFAQRAKRLAIAGDSAGGNLAAAVALRARDTGGPRLAHQLLIYPMLDAGGHYGSRESNATGYGLTTVTAAWFWSNYLRAEDDRADPYAVPMRARDLSGLPPATVITAGYDPLRDEALAYAQRLQDAGTPVRHIGFPGQIHGFWSCGGVIDAAQDLTREAARDLRAALHASAAGTGAHGDGAASDNGLAERDARPWAFPQVLPNTEGESP